MLTQARALSPHFMSDFRVSILDAGTHFSFRCVQFISLAMRFLSISPSNLSCQHDSYAMAASRVNMRKILDNNELQQDP